MQFYDEALKGGSSTPASRGRRHGGHRHPARRRRLHLPQPTRVRPGRRLRAAHRRPRGRRAAARLEAQRVLAGADPARALDRRERPRHVAAARLEAPRLGQGRRRLPLVVHRGRRTPSSVISRCTCSARDEITELVGASIYDLMVQLLERRADWTALRRPPTSGADARRRSSCRERRDVSRRRRRSSSNSTPYFSASAAYSSSSDGPRPRRGGLAATITESQVKRPRSGLLQLSRFFEAAMTTLLHAGLPKARELTLMAFYRLVPPRSIIVPRAGPAWHLDSGISRQFGGVRGHRHRSESISRRPPWPSNVRPAVPATSRAMPSPSSSARHPLTQPCVGVVAAEQGDQVVARGEHRRCRCARSWRPG